MNDETLAHLESSNLVPSEPTQNDPTAASFNPPPTAYRAEKLIHELFQEQVQRTPGALAVMHEERCLTYAELNNRANWLACQLRAAGIGPDHVVGICVDRGVEMIVGLLGILKAGGAYLPLDPNYPAERLQYMAQDAAPSVVLVQSNTRALVPALDAKLRTLDTESALPGGTDVSSAELGLTSEHLLYVIYTSGSTGRPKGIAMTHRAMTNLIEWQRRELPANGQERVLQFAALSFDVAFQETFSTLCSGGTLALLEERLRRDARALLVLLHARAITRLFVPPLMLRALAETFASGGLPPPPLRDVIAAGEQLRITPEIVHFFRHLDGCRLHNHYGPTETHVVTALTLAGDPRSWPTLPTIGRPIANTRIHLLDERREPVAPGAIGEIYIGGANVARGYLSQPSLTAQRFLRDTFTSDRRARLYRTGDLGRWRPDGTLEYLGRNDDQVKIRGFRIELGEIEARLAGHPRVNEAAVVARERESGDRVLVAYVTTSGQDRPNAEQLRAHLQAALPEYMVPSAFVVVERMPLTPSGKLDRRALPAPELGDHVVRPYEPPQDGIERTLAGIWEALLHVQRVGRQDNFFELGGHSLLVAQMLERLRAIGLHAEVRDVFGSSTLASLAGTVREVGAAATLPNLIPPGCTAITPEMLPLLTLRTEHIGRIVAAVPAGAGNIQDIYPLAPLQEGILFHHLLDRTGGDTYIVTTLLSVASNERLADLIAALQTVIDRHDVLRTAILWEALPQPVQVVYRQAPLPVDTVELDGAEEPLTQVRALMNPARQQMDIRCAPLLRLQVARAPDGQLYALLRFHHVAIDHVTFELVTAEVVACLDGRAGQLGAPIPYRDHVAQALAHARLHDAAAFFSSKLGDVDEPTAPFGLVDVHGDGERIDEARLHLAPTLTRHIRAVARTRGLSAATLFHAAWALVVARTSGRDDVVFGSMLLGRLHASADLRRSFGMFINTLPLRLRLEGLTAEQLAQQTRREIAELLDYEQASLALAQRCSAVKGTPLFSTLFNYVHGQPDVATQWCAAPGIDALQVQERTNYPITMSVEDTGDGFMLTAQTDRRVNPQRIAGYLHTAVRSLIEALDSAPERPALTLEVLPVDERERLVSCARGETDAHVTGRALHEILEDQVRRTPEAVAVVHEGESLTYAELNRRANRVAHYLLARGVQPDQLVGICLERGLEMVSGLIGIVKAGAGYLPLDPNYPAERLAYMLEDARPHAVLTHSQLLDKLSHAATQIIAIDERREEIVCESADDPDARARGFHPGNLAYVIYTSGSTGKPKGVMVEHRNVTRLFSATEHWFNFGPGDVWTLFHSIGFDFSVWELWGALLYGGRVVVVPHATARMPREFYRLVCEQGVTVLNQTPSAFAQFIDAQAHHGQLRHALRLVIFGGEALELRVLRRWIERNGAQQPLLVNMYGITETTVHVTYRALTQREIDEEQGSLIGEPIPDMHVYVLDRHGQPVPAGVCGEMYVGGGGVSRGYLNRPELTAERFLPDPFRQAGMPAAHIYRSGDLARWRVDGTLEYLGRNDNQVKIRGFRIELGEIGAELVRHAGVKDAVVLAHEDTSGDKQLVAYVVLHDAASGPGADDLRMHLKRLLPEYMVPSAFVPLAALPLTANGKLDRRALPAPDRGAFVNSAYTPPQGDTEQILAGIWRELLRVERVGRDDHFFELGGHSLLVTQAVARLGDRLGIDVPIRVFFQSPVLRDQAAQVAELRDAHAAQSIADGGSTIDELLERVAALPESEVERLLQGLKTEGRP